MNGFTKIIIGVVATALLAWGNHSLAGAGERFTNNLKAKAENAIAYPEGAPSPTISFAGADGKSALGRSATLSGDYSDSDKEAILAVVRKVPGISGAKWNTWTQSDDANRAPETSTGDPQVNKCQGNIDQLVSSDTINFRDGSAYVNLAQNGKFLDKIAAELKACRGTNIEVSGHTNTTGAPSINLSISRARAEAVLAELVKRGVPEAGLTAKGYGANRLKNKTNGAAAENRRIEFEASSASTKPASEDIGA